MTATQLRELVKGVVESHATHNTFYSIWSDVKDRETELNYPCAIWDQWRSRLEDDEFGHLRRAVLVRLLIITAVATDRTPADRDAAVEAADNAASDYVLKLRKEYPDLLVGNVGCTTQFDEYTQLETGVLLTFTVTGEGMCLDEDHFVPNECPTFEELIAGRGWASIKGAMSEAQVDAARDDLDELPTVNGVESETHTITVTQGGSPVGTFDPETGVATVPPCPGPGSVTANDVPLIAVPPDTTVGVDVVREEDGSPVGSVTAPGRIEIPSGVVLTSGGGTLATKVPPGENINLPQSMVRWKTSAGSVKNEVEPNGYDGDYLTVPYGIFDPIPRFEVRRASDNGIIDTGDITAPVVLLPVQVVKDTNGNTIATHEVNVPAEVPDSVLTLPDGSPGILPASSPFDIRTLRSGIVYAVNEGMFSGELRHFLTGDERWAYVNGLFTQDYPAYPAQFTRLVDFSTLADNNIYGNANRFTDNLGTQVYAASIVLDHFTGIAWYSPGAAMNGTWFVAVGACRALTVGGHTDWVLPPLGILRTIINNSTNIRISYAPFGIDGQSVHSSTTNPSSTANSLPMLNSGAFQSVTKTTSARYIACRRFAN